MVESTRWDYDDLTAVSLSADKATITGLDGNVAPLGRVTFDAKFIKEPSEFKSGTKSEPVVFHHDHFGDEKYRILIRDVNDTTVKLYTTTDFGSFTKEVDDLGHSDTQFTDGIVVNGEFVLYANDGSGNIDVWTGDDLQSLSRVGQAIGSADDAGAFWDEDAGTVYIFVESGDSSMSDTLRSFSTPEDDLTNSTSIATVYDKSNGPTSRKFGVGDPDIIELNGTYYIFSDNSDAGHPKYHTAVFMMDELTDSTMELVDPNITPDVWGGDMTVVRNGDHFAGLTELSGDDQADIGYWKVTPQPLQKLDFTGRRIIRGADGDEWGWVYANPSNDQVYFEAASGKKATLTQVASGNEELVAYNGLLELVQEGEVRATASGLVLQAFSGNVLDLGVSGSGQPEVILEADTMSVNASSSPPSNPQTTASYLDDGTNTGDGNPGWRYTTDGGSTWSDMN